MTRIDFYILETSTRQSRLHFAVRLTEKLYRNGLSVHLHTDNTRLLRALDDSLWTDRDISFVPHDIAETPIAGCPVTLGNGPFDGTEQVLINLATEAPPYFSQMERVVEIIDTRADDIAQGRARYAFYRDRGYPLQNHNIK